jgi:amino acid adenylation domain-containing protein
MNATMMHDNENRTRLATDKLGAGLTETLRLWSGAAASYPGDKSVSQIFEEVAAARPQSIALSCNQDHLSYAALNSRSNHLARRLRERGIGPESVVACWLDRSFELITALLAILKAGGAYVPLDPAYPKERIDFILADTAASLILTEKAFESTVLAGHRSSLMFVDDSVAAARVDTDSLATAAKATSLAYIMYTSGSTGRPKGVMVENRSVVRLVRETNYCHFGPDETFLQYAPISFDASTFEIWGALLNGGRLVLMPAQANSLEDLGRTIREEKVSTVWLTAGLFSAMIEERCEDLSSVRQLLAGGDVLSPFHVRMALEKLPNCTLINGYGPTENTTFTSCHRMQHGDPIPDSIPIGRPISNTTVYILDEEMHPVSPGTVGELYAGGDGVARGYLNDPKATALKFVADPFSEDASQRMYRTGDLARWRQDGTIEFVGRLDDQVKIRGYRVEPPEIEAVLRTHPRVKETCVVASADGKGGKHLLAYFVPESEPALRADELREYVAQKLPHYMVPARFIQLGSLPSTPNGKIDRRALPLTSMDSDNSAIIPQPPGNDVERFLVELWSQVLRVQHVSLDANFFDLGGDSLSLVTVHSKLQKSLDKKVALTDLFEFTTIRQLAHHLVEQGKNGHLSEAQVRARAQRNAFARHRELQPKGEL